MATTAARFYWSAALRSRPRGNPPIGALRGSPRSARQRSRSALSYWPAPAANQRAALAFPPSPLPGRRGGLRSGAGAGRCQMNANEMGRGLLSAQRSAVGQREMQIYAKEVGGAEGEGRGLRWGRSWGGEGGVWNPAPPLRPRPPWKPRPPSGPAPSGPAPPGAPVPMAPPGAALAAGLLFFPGLFLLAKALLRRCRCPEPHAAILAARLVSSVQAVMASTAGYIISSSCHHVIDDQHWLAGTYPQFAVPYFIYDVYAMFLCHWHRGQVKGHEVAPPPSLRAAASSYLRKDLLMVLHHAAMVLVCFPVAALWRQGKGDFFLGCLLMAELSTPFVCLGKVLILYQRQHTALHKLNGVALLVTFLLCRVLLFPYLYWAYGRQRGLPLLRVPGALPPAYNAAAAALLAPQLYWFALICRGAWRLFRTPPPPPAPAKPP